jgi:hypothetical protein
VSLRYFNVFGPRQDPKSVYAAAVPIFIDRALRGAAITIFGDGEQTRDFVFVGDVCAANMLAATSAEGRPGGGVQRRQRRGHDHPRAGPGDHRDHRERQRDSPRAGARGRHPAQPRATFRYLHLNPAGVGRASPARSGDASRNHPELPQPLHDTRQSP